MYWEVERDEKNLKETFQFPDMSFPFFAWPDVYSLFVGSRVDAHWHYEFEYSYVVSGCLDYYINDNYLKLQPGDIVFVNSNMLHMAKLSDGCSDAIVLTMAFHTSLLTSDIKSTVYSKYLRPIIDTKLEGFKISSGHPIGQEMAELVTEMVKICYPSSYLSSKSISNEYQKYNRELLAHHMDKLEIDADFVERVEKNIKDGPDFAYELECMCRVVKILAATLRYIDEKNSDLLLRTGSLVSIERAREIIAYIYTHYHEKIEVEDIAKQVGISRNECFRCFKRFTGKKPVEYLNDYRLLMAAQLLQETENSIENISAECGFASASFFGKMFKGKYGKTPLQFRKEV